MKKLALKLIFAGLPIAAALGGFTASHAQSTYAPVDLGTAWPAARNISKSPDFHVYRWESGGVPLIQINRADGRVVTAGFLTKAGFQRMAIGELARKRSRIGGGVQALGVGLDDGDESSATGGQCPCRAQVVYDDGNTRIVVVTDKENKVIETIVIDLKKSN